MIETPHSSGLASFLSELRRSLPDRAVIEDPDVLEAHRRDRAGQVAAGKPAVLVRPSRTTEVQEVLRLASLYRIPIVPRGAGSGLSGGANAIDGCAILSLAKMDRILKVDSKMMTAVVQPGVINATLAAAASDKGMCYPPDPASYEFSTIGGNLATNAGGLCCVKYGVTRDAVLSLEIVLADGAVVRTGGLTRKNVAGFDLTGLFVGSEGTLGVITEATLRLRPRPGPSATLVGFFPTLAATGVAITDIATALTPSLLELMDRTTVRAVEQWKPMDLDTDAAALLVAASDAGGDQAEAEVAEIARACRGAGASYVTHSTDPAEGDVLLSARRLAYLALERLGSTLLDDIAVPIPYIPAMLERISQVAHRHNLLIGTFGHAGDGNLHPTIVFDEHDNDSELRARAAFDAILHAALDMGGTITGEHGIGVLKQPYLAAEIGATGMRVHYAIKQALDPVGILNPGKVLADEARQLVGQRDNIE